MGKKDAWSLHLWSITNYKSCFIQFFLLTFSPHKTTLALCKHFPLPFLLSTKLHDGCNNYCLCVCIHEQVPSRAEEITIPADVTPEHVPTHIVDYSGTRLLLCSL